MDLRFETLSCHISISGNKELPDVRIEPNYVYLNALSSRRFITLHVGYDNDCRDTTLILQIECRRQNGQGKAVSLPSEARLELLVNDRMPLNFCNDPRIFQTVKVLHNDGRQTLEDICYDFIGKAGEQYEFFSDKLLGVSVIFELKDSYEVSRLLVKTKFGLIQAGLTSIGLPNHNLYSWDRIMDLSSGINPRIRLRLSPNELVIEFEENGRELKLRIIRKFDNFNIPVLKTFIDELSSGQVIFDQYHGGLLGLVSNKKYNFYQVDSFDKTSPNLYIEGREVKTFKKPNPHFDNKCYSMNLKDILYPNGIELLLRNNQ
ncbi:DgyrCDS9730 [Dimorphilus gyrociliatus]|uniref:DgyrCDS9730 n=1 Tax=Dimorphilus gyrociliatus TaxID=2664684 RepID=A0A7I8VXV5_9ANNE|nr:DgyrCDS9730 [Dimorphilus gyrociliatus]